ncbi:hypothetical protein [Frigidibacter mobilis]|uniref:hypothetical protein n=1 Tax=Frigidibacter mobilis TaxID=1335048 RepID=UPI00141299C2|nr:hypothetical protein [Frigidibacter mobilis]
MLFIPHDFGVVRQISDRIGVLQRGASLKKSRFSVRRAIPIPKNCWQQHPSSISRRCAALRLR